VVARGDDEEGANAVLEEALVLLERLLKEAGRDFQR
jgi:hypothetical protein